MTEHLLALEHVEQQFDVKGGKLRAVDDVTLHIDRADPPGPGPAPTRSESSPS
mgnify:CR=1 FL=1